MEFERGDSFFMSNQWQQIINERIMFAVMSSQCEGAFNIFYIEIMV